MVTKRKKKRKSDEEKSGPFIEIQNLQTESLKAEFCLHYIIKNSIEKIIRYLKMHRLLYLSQVNSF